eukprot:TRINITY_DN12445_c0_g1_i1.p1 TRINITY_DN12445_c0_g1~~TRINITY_DN12445_c0_g1_i1.p1  ORF type:complete len:394 (-),score=85.09 TRINITY_DN12445_c0_g1_i1:111-1292(-)
MLRKFDDAKCVYFHLLGLDLTQNESWLVNYGLARIYFEESNYDLALKHYELGMNSGRDGLVDSEYLSILDAELTKLFLNKQFENGIPDFIVQRKLGSGSNGSVYQVSVSSSSYTFALKWIYNIYSLQPKGLVEMYGMEKLQTSSISPYIVNPYKYFCGDFEQIFEGSGIVRDDISDNNNGICFIMDTGFCDLESVINTRRENQNYPYFTKNEIITILQRVVEGIKYLNTNRIIHRDLTPRNIIIMNSVDETKPFLESIRIIDFGCSLNLNFEQVNAEPSGAPYVQPPEIFEAVNSSENFDYSKYDLYALGKLILSLANEVDIIDIEQCNLEEIERHYGEDIKDLLINCLKEFEYRCSLEEVILVVDHLIEAMKKDCSRLIEKFITRLENSNSI